MNFLLDFLNISNELAPFCISTTFLYPSYSLPLSFRRYFVGISSVFRRYFFGISSESQYDNWLRQMVLLNNFGKFPAVGCT